LRQIRNGVSEMSGSPWADFKLSTLTFRQGDGTPAIDATGNLSVEAAPLIVKAYLQIKPRSLAEVNVPAELLNRVYLVGHCVEPMRLPSGLLPGSRAQAEVNGVSGTFVLALSLPDPLGVSEITGDPIEGVFGILANRGNFTDA
jgi:hypothetical protein